MPKLGVCGDSFMAATTNGARSDLLNSEGKHFTEILAKKLGYEYFTLARGACSNTAIRLQINQMVRQDVDLVIIGFTTSNRMEIPKLEKNFYPNLGVYNLDYQTKFYPDQSTLNKNFQHNLITETFTNIFADDTPLIKKLINKDTEKCHPILSRNQLTALEFYIDYLYNPEYKTLQDAWVIHSGIKLLQDENINFIAIMNGISVYPEFKRFVGKEFIPSMSELDPQNSILYPNEGNRRWHNSDESQAKLAELWYYYLLEHNFIRK